MMPVSMRVMTIIMRRDHNRKSKTSHCWSPVRQRTSDTAVPHPQPLGTLIDALTKSGGTEGLGRLSFRRFTFSVMSCIGALGPQVGSKASPPRRPALLHAPFVWRGN
jgi:hypothetical protein